MSGAGKAVKLELLAKLRGFQVSAAGYSINQLQLGLGTFVIKISLEAEYFDHLVTVWQGPDAPNRRT
jgi:hypothetical protein